MRLVLMVLSLVLFTMGDVRAEGSWEKLLKEIDGPVENKPKDKDGSVQMLSMPDMDQAASKGDSKDVTVKFVTTYKCNNPEYPECLWDMRRKPRLVDRENCKDTTRLYLQALAAYNRCVDRRTRKHARRVVDVFNCLARGRKDCPYVYGDD